MNLGSAFTNIGMGADDVMNGGIADYARLHQLQEQQQQERAQTAAKSDLVSYLQSLNAPAPQSPPPAPMGTSSVPMQRPGPPPAGAGAPVAAPPVPPQQQMPSQLTVAGLLQTIKSKNPNASPDEVIQALQMAAPYMDAQEQQKIQTLKDQLKIQKQQLQAQNQGFNQQSKTQALAQRDRQLQIEQGRLDAYKKALETRATQAGYSKQQASQIAVVGSQLKSVNDKLALIMQKYNGMPPPKTSPDYQYFMQGQNLRLRLQQQITGLQAKKGGGMPPPPPNENLRHMPSDDTSGDGNSGGQ